MKIDEPFNPDLKSAKAPSDVQFQLADESHINSICRLMAARNPLSKIEDITNKTEKEIFLNISDPDYWLFVAVASNEVIGFCRFYHSRSLLKEKIKFKSPEGWYAMGTLVSEKHRRKSIAKFLSQERLKFLKTLNVSVLYSMVDSNNQTSIKMHQEFGFQEFSRAKGFLHLEFQDSAILFKLDIS